MDNETLANGLARQGALLQEARRPVLRLEQLTIQAGRRSKVVEDKAVAESQRSVWSRSPTRRRSSSTIAEKFWPETYTADRVDNKNFAEFLGEVETYLSVLAPGLSARPLLEWAAAFRGKPVVVSDVEAYEAAHGNLSTGT